MKAALFQATKQQLQYCKCSPPLRALELFIEYNSKRGLSSKAKYYERNANYTHEDQGIKKHDNFHAHLPGPNFLDPSGNTLFMFPGQGSQYMGMAQDLIKYPNVTELYKAASEVLKQDLLQICLKGPKDKLNQIVTSQIAVFVTSIASIEKIRSHQPLAVEKCVCALGFGVGEISALVFAGSLSFENGLTLAKKFGECLEKASQEEAGGMLTVRFEPGAKVGQALEAAREHCQKVAEISDPVCDKAMYLFPHAIVVAGNEEALRFLVKNGKDFGITYTKRLAMKGAFHTRLMEYSHMAWISAVQNVDIQVPLIPVYSSFSSQHYEHVYLIKRNLEKLYCNPVRWLQLMKLFYGNPPKSPFPRPYICAPSQVLRTTLRETCPQAAETAVCLGLD